MTEFTFATGLVLIGAIIWLFARHAGPILNAQAPESRVPAGLNHSELIDWLKLLMADDIPEEILTNRDTTKAIPPLYGALVKNEQDVQLLERLAFMNRRQSGNSGGQS